MSTPAEDNYARGLAFMKAHPEKFKNRKGTDTHYADGKPKVEGKTKAQIRAENKARIPKINSYHVDTSDSSPKTKALNWAKDVGEARSRNQKVNTKHYTDKGYREDYR